jgi:hypothetical protein
MADHKSNSLTQDPARHHLPMREGDISVTVVLEPEGVIMGERSGLLGRTGACHQAKYATTHASKRPS